MEIGERIRQLRESSGIKRTWLAQRVGTTSNYLYKVEKGKANPSKRLLKRIAEVLNVAPEYFLGESELKTSDVLPIERPLKKIPIYGTVPAGSPRESFDDIPILGYIYFPDVPEGTIALKVVGDSMIGAGIDYGDVVLVYPPYYESLSGKVVVARIDGSEFTVKRFYRERDTIILNPDNGNYKPIVMTVEEAKHRLEIVGVVKKVVKNI